MATLVAASVDDPSDPFRNCMPTKYKAQLDHVGFDWTTDVELILRSLMARKNLILAKAGFSGVRGCTYNPATRTFQTERSSFIEAICGALSWAAAVQMDGGYKAVNKIISTLKAVEMDPSIISSRNVEPEALGMIASQYQRADETPGKFGFDVYQDEGAHELDLQQVRRAATLAISVLQTEVKMGRPKNLPLDILAKKLCDLFLRYNEVATRHSIASDGKVAQMEAGPYFDFCETVIASLNQFLAGLPRSYEATPISAAQVARRSAELRLVRR
jgi:hypothetical protein